MPVIKSFLATLFGGPGTAAVIVAACMAFVAWFVADQRATGAMNERHDAAAAAAANATQAIEDAKRVPRDGSFEWLRQHYCADC